MVAGHLQIKKGYYYAVLSWNNGVKDKQNGFPSDYPKRGTSVKLK